MSLSNRDSLLSGRSRLSGRHRVDRSKAGYAVGFCMDSV